MKEDLHNQVKRDIRQVLKRAQRHINKGDTRKLKHLSDKTINNAAIFQDSDSVSIAVAIYALSKLLERWGFDSEYAEQSRNILSAAYFSLERGDESDYRDKMKQLLEFISNVDKKFKLYVEKVIEKAQIKKGSTMYDRGLSYATVADILGIGQWELMSYIGKTKIHDEQTQITGVESRIKFARSLFIEK